MPLYELSLIMRILPRVELLSALNRIGTHLLDTGVVLQKIEHFGTKDLPYTIAKDEVFHTKGSYFVFNFVGSPRIFNTMNPICYRDVDIVRHGFMPVYKEGLSHCTLEEELQPPALRKSVQNLLANSDKIKKRMTRPYWYRRDYKYFHEYM